MTARTFCVLKDFRAIATRYDKTARDSLAGLCLVTALCYWLNRARRPSASFAGVIMVFVS
jgi:hypothetical protein